MEDLSRRAEDVPDFLRNTFCHWTLTSSTLLIKQRLLLAAIVLLVIAAVRSTTAAPHVLLTLRRLNRRLRLRRGRSGTFQYPRSAQHRRQGGSFRNRVPKSYPVFGVQTPELIV
jgi:hypothetical protein